MAAVPRPEPNRNYSLPLVGSAVLHALVLATLFWSWQRPSQHTPMPPVIQARLVKLTAQAPPAPKPAPEPPPSPEPIKIPEPVKPAPPPEPVKPVAKPQPSKPELAKPKPDKSRQKARQDEKLKQEQIERQKQEAAAKAAQAKTAEQKKQADEALARALADENAQQQARADSELSQSYADRIRQRVEENWSRPPSARKDMEVLLEIGLVPTGYVTGVSIVKGSGNEAFDLSAQQAVRRAEPFPEVKDIPPRIFEQHFRRFQMLFRVDDPL